MQLEAGGDPPRYRFPDSVGAAQTKSDRLASAMRVIATRGEPNARSNATRPCRGTIASVTAASVCRLPLPRLR